MTFSDLSGTGSAFAGNGSQVTFVNGTNTLGTVVLNQQLNSAGLRLGFRSLGNRYLGVDNLQISGSLAPQPADVHNFSFENETSLPGLPIQIVPTRWTAFNNPGPADFSSQRGSGVDYSVFDPLAATADGRTIATSTSSTAAAKLFQPIGPTS